MLLSDEQIAAEGLNISVYSGKWKKAKWLAYGWPIAISENYLVLPYWERVRLLFLELGGEYANNK